MKILIFIVLLIFLTSCANHFEAKQDIKLDTQGPITISTEPYKPPKTNIDPDSFLLAKKHVDKIDGIYVASFDISECKSDCPKDSGGIYSLSMKQDTLLAKIGCLRNCGTTGARISEAKLKNNILSLSVSQIPIRYTINSKDDTIFMYRVAQCECYLLMNFKICGLTSIPKHIKIDGFLLKNY